jgi:hypothetical protein
MLFGQEGLPGAGKKSVGNEEMSSSRPSTSSEAEIISGGKKLDELPIGGDVMRFTGDVLLPPYI